MVSKQALTVALISEENCTQLPISFLHKQKASSSFCGHNKEASSLLLFQHDQGLDELPGKTGPLEA